MKLEIFARHEQVTLDHNGPTDSRMEGLVFTRAAAHAMLDTVLDSIDIPEDK